MGRPWKKMVMSMELASTTSKACGKKRKKMVWTMLPPSRPPRLAMEQASTTSKACGKKKWVSKHLWMRIDSLGQSETIECDKSVIIKRFSIPARDLGLLGPIFYHPSGIIAREKCMILSLEFIRALVSAEEVMLLDPLQQEVLVFVDQLTRHLSSKNRQHPEASEDELLLPFEFQVLEIALKVTYGYLESSVSQVERNVYPALDEVTKSVSTKNLEYMRTFKSNLTRLLARVHKVRDEIEHLLDDNGDMAQLHLTRNWIQTQQWRYASNDIVPAALCRPRSGNNYEDVQDLEILLEDYFMLFESTRSKILSLREHIGDTEDYVTIQLNGRRNEMMQLKLIFLIASFAIAVETGIAGMYGMNIKIKLYDTKGVFWQVVGLMTVACLLLFFVVLGYARWKRLLGS
ncbi:magnesium transporter MRS2-4-like [Salvia miltiorrhiza]|uniref:magnesium transporter MRS2-4-like n=1 Tax=Salvia miltiorrhiza TaxID=226208 RepID=UPI0025ACF7A1|nr:magnesium transporter MRS2-4-like [Salvia miltiorrhiza]XP_057792297.1 magnesium transporter MRS2-4-like [Salvia miltiorrhiza]